MRAGEAAPSPQEGEGASPEGGRVAELEAELRQTRERLQGIIEEYETSQEELRASNEEMQSSNEELRSTMEELETSKEELQSMNEELQTVNQENRHKVEELSQLSSDLQNLLAATDIATLFLDRELRIMRYTPRIAELFSVRPADRGRPVGELTHRLHYDDLEKDARRVLDRLIPIEREVTDRDGRCYMTRLLPYRSQEDRIDGVVATFVDITDRIRAEEEVRDARDYAESIVETLHEPLLVLDPDLRVKTVNQAFYDHFEVRERETIGQRIYDLGNGQWDIPKLRELLEDVLPDSKVFNDYEVSHVFEDIGERVMLLNARRLDHVQLILLGIRDVTERKHAERELERRVEERTREVRELAETLSVAEQEERQRLSHLLHDDLQQLLYGIQMKVTVAVESAEREEVGAAVEQGRESLKLLEQAIARTRQLTVDLNPPILEGEGLVGAIEWLRTQMRDLHGVEVQIQAEEPVDHPSPELRILLFQITRELLFNVAKHAGTDRAMVEVGVEDGRVRVTVIDHGAGFDPDSVEPGQSSRGGLGLFSARERLRMRGGDLDVRSGAGEGTRVTAYAPLAPVP